ncbi:MAG: hypothetical protein FWF46_03875 [Oscillospiraceae bacterium]|nr:hypothetical protein [Oscillospiraceae bacterium]
MKKIILIVILVLIIILGVVFYKYNDVIIPIIYSSEDIGSYEIKTMLEAKKLNPKTYTFNLGNETVTIPLPDGAVEFKNNAYPNDMQFLISLKNDNLEKYLNVTLPNNGYKVDQEGSGIFIESQDGTIKFVESVAMFTANFMKMRLSI